MNDHGCVVTQVAEVEYQTPDCGKTELLRARFEEKKLTLQIDEVGNLKILVGENGVLAFFAAGTWKTAWGGKYVINPAVKK